MQPVVPGPQLTQDAIDAAYPPLGFHELHRAGERGWWRTLLGVVLLAVTMVILAPAFWLVPFTIGFAVAGEPVGDSMSSLLDLGDPTPLGLAYLNLSLASLIPVVWFLTRVLHGLKPRWTTSVFPRMRWGYFVACLGISVLALIATVMVSALLPAQEGTDISATPQEFTREIRDFMIVVLLLTPLQAAGEEYAFRGYLTQAFGGLFRSRAVAVLVPALLFALAHGLGQSIPIFFDRFAFGIVAGLLVVLTGGLEAALAMHVLNNWLAFGLALAFSDMATALNPTESSWWTIPTTLTQSLVYLGLALLVARAMGLRRTADSAVLVASRGRVYGFSSAPGRA
ncbi:lysostaphin resistance A-like protein [Nocardioides pacificus]